MKFVYRMQQQYEEERLQRLVQEEAVKFLWTQVTVVHQLFIKFQSLAWVGRNASSSGPCMRFQSMKHV